MDRKLKYALGIASLALSAQAMAQVTFYEGVGFRGQAFTTDRPVSNFQRSGFNDRASSVVVDNGRWEVCEDVAFRGRCVVLRPGSYESLSGMGMNKRISSVRPAANYGRQDVDAPAPMAEPNYEYRRRPQERVFDAAVTSVHAVVGPPNERCWVERERVDTPRANANVGGAIVGALIGGILGHQVAPVPARILRQLAEPLPVPLLAHRWETITEAVRGTYVTARRSQVVRLNIGTSPTIFAAGNTGYK